MLNSTNIAQINKALSNSFAAIKKDMDDIKVLIASQTDQNSEFKQQMVDVKKDFASKDKLDVLKIKLGEVNEGLKKIWDVEKQLKSLGSTGSNKAVQQAIDELNSKIIAMNMRLTELNKTSVSETQLKALTNDINNELNSVNSSLRESEMRRDEVRREDIEKYNAHIIKKIESVDGDLAELKKTLKGSISKDDLKNVLNELDNDFISVRKEMQSAAEKNKKFVTDVEVKSTLDSINKEFDAVANEIAVLKKEKKDYVKTSQVKGLIEDISSEFDDIKKDLSSLNNVKEAAATKKELDEVRDEFSQLEKNVDKLERNVVTKDDFARELRQIDKDLESLEKKTPKITINAKMPAKRFKTAHRGKYVLGNMFLILAVILLIASMYFYYIGIQPYIDNFAIAAVIVFIVGMFTKAYAATKSSKV